MNGSEHPTSAGPGRSADRVFLELCAGSLGDVEIAARCHVNRIELNSGMAVGGLTPTAALTQMARQTFAGPIISMIRPREGGFCYSKSDFLLMLKDAELLLPLGIEGLATGFLTGNGCVDVERCRRLRALFPKVQLVFHRAFDVVSDQIVALKQLIDCGFDRVLTSGGAATAVDGRQRLKELLLLADGRIEILPGGGIRASNVRELVSATGCRQIHSAVREVALDASIQETAQVHYGLPGAANGSYGQVSETALQQLQAELLGDLR